MNEKMKKIISVLLTALMCFSVSACGEKENDNTSVNTDKIETESVSYEPTIESVTEGIKNQFKDPDSVQISEEDAVWAPVMEDGERSKTEFYIICTVRAKNSFGGYGEPQAYVIHCNYDSYEIVEEYNDYSFMSNKKLSEYGCDVIQGLKHKD